MKHKPIIALALGSGSSRGWSHIGIIRALNELGIDPEIVCGTSIGALVGASYVNRRLDHLEKWVLSLDKFETAKFFEINSAFKGFVNSQRFRQFLNENVANDDTNMEDLVKRFASVATDLRKGREIWMTKGSLVDAVWASISLPGLFPAIRHDRSWLVDGGLVNPVPVSVCHALGADIVIAVNLNGDIVGKHLQKSKPVKSTESKGVTGKISEFVKGYANSLFSSNNDSEQDPGVFDVLASSFNITQDRITRSRLAGDPPDILLSPRLAHIGLLEFYRASEAMEEGRRVVKGMQSEIEFVIDSLSK